MIPHDRSTVTFAIRAPLARADLSGLYARACLLLADAPAATVVCDVAGVGGDAVAVDALARLALAASRHGCAVRLRSASPELRCLLAFVGLDDVLAD